MEATQVAPTSSIPIQYFIEEDNMHELHVAPTYQTMVSTGLLTLGPTTNQNRTMEAQISNPLQNQEPAPEGTWICNLITP